MGGQGWEASPCCHAISPGASSTACAPAWPPCAATVITVTRFNARPVSQPCTAATHHHTPGISSTTMALPLPRPAPAPHGYSIAVAGGAAGWRAYGVRVTCALSLLHLLLQQLHQQRDLQASGRLRKWQ